MNWLIARLREPSTMRGFVWLLTVFGLSLRPDQADAIVVAGMALAGLLGVFLSDDPRPSSAHDPLPPIELQGHPESRNAGADPDPVQSADQLRQSVPPGDQPRPYQSADPNTYPRFGGNGWGDRD